MARVTSDENGFVRGFGYHDGHLEGILRGSSEKEIHLALRSSTGERRVLTLGGVVALCADNFREGNIVLNLRMLPAAKALSEDGIRRALAERLYIDASKLPVDSSVFLLDSSYGAEIIAICGEARISDVGVRPTIP